MQTINRRIRTFGHFRSDHIEYYLKLQHKVLIDLNGAIHDYCEIRLVNFLDSVGMNDGRTRVRRLRDER